MISQTYMENCILDYKNEIRIPQNDNNDYGIIEDLHWKYSIKISINIREEIDYVNLFFILKSYASTKICIPSKISTVFLVEEKLKVTQYESIFKINDMGFDYFYEWINYRIKNDWEYDRKTNFYSILISFEKNSIISLEKKENCSILQILKPIYPWTDGWLNKFKKSIEEKKRLEKEIEYLKSVIRKKNEEIDILKKK